MELPEAHQAGDDDLVPLVGRLLDGRGSSFQVQYQLVTADPSDSRWFLVTAEPSGLGPPTPTPSRSLRPWGLAAGPSGLLKLSIGARARVLSADVFDDRDQLVEAVFLAAGEVDELLGSLDDGPAFGCAGHHDAAAASELE